MCFPNVRITSNVTNTSNAFNASYANNSVDANNTGNVSNASNESNESNANKPSNASKSSASLSRLSNYFPGPIFETFSADRIFVSQYHLWHSCSIPGQRFSSPVSWPG